MDIKTLRNTLKPRMASDDFIQKGTHWEQEAKDFIKAITILKSQFSDFYFINFGFVIKGLPLEGTPMHVYIGLGTYPIKYSQDELNLLNFNYLFLYILYMIY